MANNTLTLKLESALDDIQKFMLKSDSSIAEIRELHRKRDDLDRELTAL